MAYNVTNIEENRSFSRIFTVVCLLISCVAATGYSYFEIMPSLPSTTQVCFVGDGLKWTTSEIIQTTLDFTAKYRSKEFKVGTNSELNDLCKRSTSFLAGVTVEDVLNRAVDDDMVSVDINDITGTGSSSDSDTTSTVTTSTSTTTSGATSSTTSSSSRTATSTTTSDTTSTVTTSATTSSTTGTSGSTATSTATSGTTRSSTVTGGSSVTRHRRTSTKSSRSTQHRRIHDTHSG